MILDNVKPLMIVWLPVGGKMAEIGDWFGKQFTFDTGEKSSFVDDAVNFVFNRTTNYKQAVTSIPIPFYFYERLANVAGDDVTGFLLDSVTENIDITYPDTPTTQSDSVAGALADKTFALKNTIEISFRVKNGSTLVSVFRSLMKRVLTEPDTVRDILFDFYWHEYIMKNARVADYNESPVGTTDMTMIKIKLQKSTEVPSALQSGDADGKEVPKDETLYQDRGIAKTGVK